MAREVVGENKIIYFFVDKQQQQIYNEGNKEKEGDYMREINILSWGGGTQSTALMLKMLNGEIKENDKPINIDYIMFADTGDENQFVYTQIHKVIKYIKEHYNRDIIIAKKTKEKKTDDQIIEMVKTQDNFRYRSSPYADLYQNHLLFYKGYLTQTDLVPHWVINKDGTIGKLMGRQCTVEYKINTILKELRTQENIKRFDSKKYQLNMFIGFSVDEMYRLKPSPSTYIINKFPLIKENMTKKDCIDYVIEKLGFKPISSVCNMCYANDFDRVYDIYKYDKEGWERLLILDEAMANKTKECSIRGDVYMFQWQIKLRKRLKEIDMEKIKAEKSKYKQMSIFEEEQTFACMGGCFL